MYYYRNTTQTPNELFDHLLKELTLSELKVLLTVIRKTLGQVDPRDATRRLERAWISQGLFVRCCGLSGRAVSTAIDSLVRKGLVEVTDGQGRALRTKWERRGSNRLYYASLLRLGHSKGKTCENPCTCPVNVVHTIKPNNSKPFCYNRSQGLKKLSDVNRFRQMQKKDDWER